MTFMPFLRKIVRKIACTATTTPTTIMDIAQALSTYPSSMSWIIVIEASWIFGESRKITALIVTILLSKKNSVLFQKLILLRRVTQEAQARRETLQNVWEKMQKFAQGLRNELDGMYWSENLIAFEDLETVPQFN